MDVEQVRWVSRRDESPSLLNLLWCTVTSVGRFLLSPLGQPELSPASHAKPEPTIHTEGSISHGSRAAAKDELGVSVAQPSTILCSESSLDGPLRERREELALLSCYTDGNV